MKRRGITLTEVLVAIFVTGLGLISLMTLFPLGALNMAQAIKDDRSAAAAVNANGYLRTLWRASLLQGSFDSNIDGIYTANPAPADGTPVYLDPIGKYSSGQGTISGTSISRVSLATLDSSAQKRTLTLTYFSLLDDYTFDLNGLPKLGGTNSSPYVERDGLYTWAYMLRRPRTNDPRVLEYQVVVYRNRQLVSSSPETADTAVSSSPGTNTFTLSKQLPIKRGNWVLDATMPPNAAQPQGYFYRVVNVSSDGLTVEVQTPLRGSLSTTLTPYNKNGTLVVMESVVEVFDKSTLE